MPQGSTICFSNGMIPTIEPSSVAPGASPAWMLRQLRFDGLGCGELSIPVGLGSGGTGMQLTHLPIAAPQVLQGTDNICFGLSSRKFTTTQCTVPETKNAQYCSSFSTLAKSRCASRSPIGFCRLCAKVNIFRDWNSDIILGSVIPDSSPEEKPVMASPTNSAKKSGNFDPRKFLATIGEGRKVVGFPKKQTIFTQGELADAVLTSRKARLCSP